jgi:CelD/BcsL family acetyltransferase involved in cellulose biosynthesis
MHSYCFLGTPLVDRDHLDRFATSFATSARRRHHRRFLALGSVGDGKVFKAIRSTIAESDGLRVAYQEEHERAVLRRRPQPDYLSDLKSRHRRELRRLRRKLGEELGGELVVVDRAEEVEAREEFLRIEGSGWKGREGTAMGCIDGVGDFFREMCAGFAARGRLQMLSLETEGAVAAMKCNLGAGDAAFSFKIAYQDELSRFSPGILLEVENVEVFHERGSEQLLDSCAEPGNEMINRLWPDRRSIESLVLGPSGPSSTAFGLVGNVIRRARERRHHAR